MNGGPGLLAPAQSFCKPRQPFHTATAATTLQGTLGVKALARPKGTSDGPLSLAIETSDLKMKVATLEGELEQQQESMQAMGEEPHHVALCHMPCVQWCSWISTLCLCPLGFWGREKGTTRMGLTGRTVGWGAISHPESNFCLHNPLQEGFRAPFCG